MVEFMLVLPVLIILLYGIIEFSRLVFIFASTANASRQAARYGAGSGEIGNGAYFQDCEGIREAANRSAILTEFDEINITYDRGLTPDGDQVPIEAIDPSPQADTCPIEDNIIRNGDRIIVQVSTSYEPIIPILPLDPLTIVSASARTFLISVPIYGSALPMEFHPETPTPSRVPTDPNATNTPLPTATSTRSLPPTSPGGGGTQIIPTRTDAPPPTLTFTPSRTPLPTFTPSITPTFISCSGERGVTHGPLIVRDNFIRMSVFNNTEHTLSVAQIYVEWNHDTGHRGSDPTLRLRQILFANQAWQGDIHAPSAFIPGFYPPIPPGESTIEFRFHQNYNLEDGTERIIITIGTPGCINYPVDSRK